MEVWIQQFISTDQLVDIGLNVLGYVAAGALWLVIYSTWQNRRARRTSNVDSALPTNAHTLNSAKTPTKPAVSEAGDFQFMDLRGVTTARRKGVPVAGGDDETVGKRRNHAEVFATARKMMEKGATADTIKSVLPISDGELALISGSK